MADLLEFRVGELSRMSGHYRELAASLWPEHVSVEIEAVADAIEDELTRINLECVGRRACPCEFRSFCAALGDDSSAIQALNAKQAA
jgi:hypothetical protein